MVTSPFSESVVEDAALAWFDELGYAVVPGPSITFGESGSERADPGYHDVVLEQRLRQALDRINPQLPEEALEDAYRRIASTDGPSLPETNRTKHRMLVDGLSVEYKRADGSIGGALARVLDFDDPDNNDWLAVNQFTVVERGHTRRADVVLFVNGLPLAVLELKNPAGESSTVWSAFHQLETYQDQIPSLFATNAVLVASDGVQARVGTIGSGREWFKPWRTIDGKNAAEGMPELEVVLRGLLSKTRFLQLVQRFIAFEDLGGGKLAKKIAGYHQFDAVNVAVEETLRAADLGLAQPQEPPQSDKSAIGDRRIGVVWHTQGSGKSLTMLYYAGRVILHPRMANPTIVVLTDRNDLDDQLFGTFARCRELLRQPPVQALDRADLRKRLSVVSGGVIFTTIQKFFPSEPGGAYPPLSDRRNIVVIADEAHRSQYDFIDGFARHMRDALPNASFIGFTGTPIETTDANTRAVFGDYISIYDIQRAVEDRATVPIYYESRLAALELDEEERPRIDRDFEEVTEGEELERKERLKSKWAQLEAIVGSEKRLRLIAEDIVHHFELREEALEGKGMIVCMSRRICVDLYRELVRLRPEWDAEHDDLGAIKVVMTGSASDPIDWQPHIRSKRRREVLANRFRAAEDSLKLVIVRDMWLTGFDAPSLHTMYVDKPMRGHGLMQTIARVNRVFRDKPGGLVVDYLGLGQELRAALTTYTESGGSGEAAIDQAAAVTVMLEKYEICSALFHGFDWSAWTSGTPNERLSLLPAAQEHILSQYHGSERIVGVVRELSRAFALAVPSAEAVRIRADVAFFQAVKTVLSKRSPADRSEERDLDHAVRQILSRAVSSEAVADIFAASGIKRPDISILSDDFLAEVRGMPQTNLAADLLRKLLAGEIKERRKRNIVQARSFAEMLEETIRRYQGRAIEAAEVVDELIRLARELRDADQKGEALGLTYEEMAFYDALRTSETAASVLGDETLWDIARELIVAVRANVSIDWTIRENVRAHIRVIVKRILRQHGYPPDSQERATITVLEQAEALSREWTGIG